MVNTFDQHWLVHLEKEKTIMVRTRTKDNRRSSYIKKTPYHSSTDFALWFFELLKELAYQLIDIHQDKLITEIANFKAQSTTIFSESKQSNLEKLNRSMIALDSLRKVVASMMSINDFSKEIQEDLPSEIFPIIDLLEKYFDKSKKYPIQQSLEECSEESDDNFSGLDNDSEPEEQEVNYSPGTPSLGM